MKITRFLLSTFAVVLAASVTLGSMYVTIGAAVNQETQTEPSPTSVQPVSSADVVAVAVQEATPPGNAVGNDVATQTAPVPVAPVTVERSVQVVLDQNGGFVGRISTIQPGSGSLVGVADMTVKIVGADSGVTTTKTNTNGEFHVSALTDGVVAVLVYNAWSLDLFAARLVQPGADAAAVVNDFQINAAAVSPVDLPAAIELLFREMGEQRVPATAGLNEAPLDLELAAAHNVSSSLTSKPVRLQADGSLRGLAVLLGPEMGQSLPVTDLRVHLLRNGKHVATSSVEKSGQFVVAGLKPGIFSLVAAGSDGILAMGIEVLSPIGPGTYQPVSLQNGPQLVITPAPSSFINGSNFSQLTDGVCDSTVGPNAALAPPGSPFGGPGPGGFGGGGFGGGGAGGGGGGLLGTLIGGAIGAGIGYAVSDRNNDAASASK